MCTARRLIALAILAGSLLAAWFIVAGGTRRTLTIVAPRFSTPQETARTRGAPSFLAEPAAPANLTDEMAGRLGATLARGLQNGARPEAADAVDAALLSNDALDSLRISFTAPEINAEAIKVSYEDDAAVWENYLKNASAVVRQAFEPISLGEDLFSSYTEAQFEALDAAYNRAIDDLLSLVAPRRLRLIHEERIRLLTAQRNIFRALRRASADPAAASAAVGSFQEVNDNFAALRAALETFASEQNLRI